MKQTGSKWAVADLHCDVLSKMMLEPQLDFENARLDVTRSRLEAGGVQLQTFAIYISEVIGRPRFEHIVRQVELFRQRIISAEGGMKPLLWREDFSEDNTPAKSPAMALLSLEGTDALEGHPFYAELCYAMGIRLIGLTWNYANWAADGVMEKRGAGLTRKGAELIRRCNELGILLDVSHLSEKGFWDMLDTSNSPPIASHSNASAICAHPRNLRDEQIRALIARNGRIGLAFVPMFIRERGHVTAEDLLPHIEHICSLGGGSHLMFGSDFDGIEQHVQDLEHPGKYAELVLLLLKHYDEHLVRGWLSGNAFRYLRANLPSRRNAHRFPVSGRE